MLPQAKMHERKSMYIIFALWSEKRYTRIKIP
jgi:hypothetical protein